MSYDIIIKNGKIIDGAGNPWYHGDVGIKDGKIVKIETKTESDAIKTIDAAGLVVCPGFIDVHSHTDYILVLGSRAMRVESFIRQGITSCVIGMCELGLAPFPSEKKEEIKNQLIKIIGISEIDIKWTTFKEYLQYLEKSRCAINLITFVNYGNIRIAGGAGFSNREPTLEELKRMKEYINEAMEAGAFGFSTGLIYAPQIYAKTDELIELCKVAGKYNGLYFSHIRGEGKTVIDAIKELIEIVKKSGCKGGHIAHHKITGKIYWGKSKETLKLIEEANNQGFSITCDQYPYNRGMCNLSTALPPWAREGDEDKRRKHLLNPEHKERIKKEILEDLGNWENFIHDDGFERTFIASAPTEKWKDTLGKNITEITKIKGYKDDWETYFELLLDDPQVTSEGQGEEDIRRIMTSPYQMIGTDGVGIPNLPSLGAFHPRFYGTYPRILGKYVREEKVLTLEDAIRRMTSFPAQRLGLKDRGLIRENMCADIVIFNPDTIIDKATFEDTHQFPEGISHVIVNGVIVVENNKQNRKRPGKVLRRPN